MTKIIETVNSFLSVTPFNDDELLESCVADVSGLLIQNPPIVMYGKTMYQHRDVGFFSNECDGYRYTGQTAKPQALTSSLEKMLQHVNRLFDSNFNGILVTRYKDGNDRTGAHSDRKRNVTSDNGIGVVSVSYGAVRKFRIRDKITKKVVSDIPTISGQMIQMGGKFQKEFTHEIPVQKKIKEVRYSFTLRNYIS
jgi:alkylated DNA repair dioxygenase AlkB